MTEANKGNRGLLSAFDCLDSWHVNAETTDFHRLSSPRLPLLASVAYETDMTDVGTLGLG